MQEGKNFMDEKEKNLPENTAEIDTVSGDIENIEQENELSCKESDEKKEPEKRTQEKEAATQEDEEKAPKRKRAPLSPRTKKRLLIVGIVTGALLLLLAGVLITVSVIRNRPPKMEDVRARFEELLTKSQELNEIVWGAGLPVYSRVDAETQVFKVPLIKANGDPIKDKNGKEQVAKLRYYLYEDETYGKIVSYEYQWRVAEGQKNEDGLTVYTVYDVENNGVLSEYKNGAARFAQKTKEPIAGKEPIFQKGEYYYYALPNYENAELAASSILYSGKEDSHYDYVVPNSTYRNTDEIKAALDEVYASVFMQPVYEYLLTGIIGAENDVNLAAYTDYIEEGTTREWLMKSNDSASWQWRDPLPVAEFDFSTMKMTGGNAKKVTVTVNYRLAGESEVKEMEVDFVLENGAWYLNTPTFG